MRRALLFVILLGWGFTGISPQSAHAHAPPVDMVGHHIQLVLYADKVLVDYAVVFSEIAYYRTLAAMNTDGQGDISEAERNAYHQRMQQQLLRSLEFRVDGRALPLVGSAVDDSNPRIFSYLFSTGVPSRPGDRHEIQLYNHHPLQRGEVIEYWLKADYGIRVLGTDRWQKPEDAEQKKQGLRGVTVRYEVGKRPEGAGTIDPRQTGKRLGGGGLSGEQLKRLIQTRELSPRLIVIGLLTAMVLGALHALTPGHGKAVVAAYLVGSKGRVLDAILLGIVVTITHTFSVILLGLIALYASQYVLPQELFPWIGMVSGMIIVLLGVWLLIRRIQAAMLHSLGVHTHEGGLTHAHPHPHAPGHTHPHDPSHAHEHVPPERATLGSILSLGIAGGLIPCPDAMIVLLIAIAVRRIALGLVVIAAFSVGLAAVLITLGVLVVLAKPLIDRFTGTGKWTYRLPIASAVVVILLGAAIAIQSLISGGILSVNF